MLDDNDLVHAERADPVLLATDKMLRSILDGHLKGMQKGDLRRGVAMADCYQNAHPPYFEVNIDMCTKLYNHMLAYDTLPAMSRNDIQNGLRSMPQPEDILHFGHMLPLEYGEQILAMQAHPKGALRVHGAGDAERLPVIQHDRPQWEYDATKGRAPLAHLHMIAAGMKQYNVERRNRANAVRDGPLRLVPPAATVGRAAPAAAAAANAGTSYTATRNVHDDMIATSAQQLMERTVKEFLNADDDTVTCDCKAFVRRTKSKKEPLYEPDLCSACSSLRPQEELFYCTHQIASVLNKFKELGIHEANIGRVLQVIQRSIMTEITMQPSQSLVLQAVWWTIQKQEDIDLKKNLLITLGEQLSSGIEYGCSVCATGLKSRIISVLQTMDGNAQFMSFADLRHEVLRLAVKIRTDIMASGSAAECIAYEDDTDSILKNEMIKKFKMELTEIYKKLCTKQQLEMIERECGEYF